EPLPVSEAAPGGLRPGGDGVAGGRRGAPRRGDDLARDRRHRRPGRLPAAAQATAGVPSAKGSWARLRSDRAEPAVLRGNRSRSRLPGFSKDPPSPGGARADREGARIVKQRAASCIEIEPDLVAAAIGEADAPVEGRVSAHLRK